MFRFMALLMAFLALACVLFTARAEACSCRWDTAPEEEYARKDYVFLATVMDETVPGEFDKVVWKLKVEKVFKGDVPTSMTYETSRHFCAWRRFKKGQSYIIYGDATPKEDTKNIMGISDCSRTRSADGAEVEIEALEKLAAEDAAIAAPPGGADGQTP